MFVSDYLCVCVCVCATHHLLVGELPPLDAATVSHGLLVPLALGVAEQVHLRGDLRRQTRRSEVTAVDTMEVGGRRGSTETRGTAVKPYTTRGFFSGRVKSANGKEPVRASLCLNSRL